MGEKDYDAGYRGNQFHQGMDRGEYERGKAQKELENTFAGNQKVEVPGVAYTLVFVSPFLWMVYPVLGFTILAVCAVVVLSCRQFQAFYERANVVVFCVNTAIWYILCLLGKLPGTGKYMFSKEHEEGILQMQQE